MHSLPRAVGSLVAVPLLIVLVAGCGAAETGSNGAGPADSPRPSPTDTRQSDPVEYVPWGPDDPVIPGYYNAMANGECADDPPSDEESPFWGTVDAVCRAVLKGGPWPLNSEIPPNPTPADAHEACLNSELREFLVSAFGWHEANPDQDTVDLRRTDRQSPCFLTVYDIAVSPVADGADPSAGVVATLTVDGTYEVTGVSANETPFATDEDGFDPLPGQYATPNGAGGTDALTDVEVGLPVSDSRQTVAVSVAVTNPTTGQRMRDIRATVNVLPGAEPDPSPTPDPTESGSPTSDPGASPSG